ncbi:hypothetical protein, partial [Streptomyces sp. NPDC088141]|uniref:hypothetical protein n=1 Tax=Streptomyces sp. NPDC088141 TaxID=3155179 RepID=UPI00341F39DA
YDGGSVPEFGTGSESPMGGPVYHYDADLDSPDRLNRSAPSRVWRASYAASPRHVAGASTPVR